MFFDHMDRATDLPHLQYTEDTSQFDFKLMNINTGNMSLSRFALETVLFSTDPADRDMKFDETKSIDDEYTPGVFTVYIILQYLSIIIFIVTLGISGWCKNFFVIVIQRPTHYLIIQNLSKYM